MSDDKKIFDTTDSKAAKTIDGFDNFIARLGMNTNNTLSAGMYTFNLLTRNRTQLEAAYRGSWIVGRVIDSFAEDMTKAGIEITTNGEDADVKDIHAEIANKKIWNSIEDLIKWGKLYGGAIAVMQIDGQDLESPLRVETIAKGQFLGLAIFDRWQLNPDLTSLIEEGPDIGLPEYYYIVTTASSPMKDTDNSGQIKVHHSRCIRNIGIKLPFFQAITEMMWGESVLERMWDRLIAFDTATMSAANLIERANNRTIGVDGYRDIIASGGKAQAGLEKQFEAMREFQTNEGLTVMDKEDTFTSTSYSFAGLSDVMIQFGTQVSGSSEIPIVRLFGQSPAGFSTGDSDLRSYYDNVNAEQNSQLKSGWTTLLQVLWRSVKGVDAPNELEFKFIPLWQVTALDKANIAKTNTESITGAFDSGLISQKTAMTELRQQADETGIFSSITDDDIKDAEAEEPPAPNLDPDDPLNKPPTEPVKNLDSKPTIKQRIKSWLK